VLRTKLCQILDIELPIILAPMGGAVSPALAAAVSNAGGLGNLPLWTADPDDVVTIVRETRARTGKPFAVNLNMEFPQEERLSICLGEGVPVISFFWQDPSSLVQKAKDGGAIVMHTVGDAESARRSVEAGVDVIVAQGWEAGGHVRGTVASMPLIPAIVDAVGDVPVVAAGGIADGRGIVAALALGASGAWIGTRFLAAEEISIHDEYQRHVLSSSETNTVFAEELFNIGWPNAPHRVLRNSTVDAWEAAGRPPPGQRPGEDEVVASSPEKGNVVRYSVTTPREGIVGDVEALPMWAGQSVGLVQKVQPAAEIVKELTSEASEAISRLASLSA
jgi:NAD(P)H-dependent flavin oxidoreductase YrpB (nitropropane dioxygenase family)